jgi:hypothetical protein
MNWIQAFLNEPMNDKDVRRLSALGFNVLLGVGVGIVFFFSRSVTSKEGLATELGRTTDILLAGAVGVGSTLSFLLELSWPWRKGAAVGLLAASLHIFLSVAYAAAWKPAEHRAGTDVISRHPMTFAAFVVSWILAEYCDDQRPVHSGG